jgi:TorA maturation chaperone TorD
MRMLNQSPQKATEEGTSGRHAAAAARMDECRAQAGLYKLLGRCLEEEVDGTLLQLLRGELRAALAQAGVTFDGAFFSAAEQALLDTLAEEFTGLFVAPGGVSPYASVFETGCMFQQAADRAARAYQAAGWSYERRLSGEFADHIGTMLAFVGVLNEAEACALEQGDVGLADLCRQRRRTFLAEELGPWAPAWCRRAASAALHVFYRQFLTLAEQVLWMDLAACTDRRQLKELAELNRREPVKLEYVRGGVCASCW